MQIVPTEDNLREMSNPCFLGKNKKKTSKCRRLKFLFSVWRAYSV